MINNILLVFDDFDPVNKYKFELVQETFKILDINMVIFLYEKFKQEENVFQQDEKVALLGASIPESNSVRYLIDGDSFNKENLSILKKIQLQKNKYKSSIIYLVLNSYEFNILKENKDFAKISALVKFVVHLLPEDLELLESYSFASTEPMIIKNTDKLYKFSKASIFNVSKDYFEPIVIEYMNRSSECAIQRVKRNLSEKRFKHCLRVAGTVKQICEVLEVEDSELKYDVYLAALYHDICKEMEPNKQKNLAINILGIDGKNFKEYHAHIGAWYLKTQYLLDNKDMLEAIDQHTNPEGNPKNITVYLYLADKLEVAKKDRYPEDVYKQAWNLIEQKKPVEALNFLLFYMEDLRKSKKESHTS